MQRSGQWARIFACSEPSAAAIRDRNVAGRAPLDATQQQDSSMAQHNAFYAQSGGVTAVINASACGVIEACRHHDDRIGKVYAGHNGIIGALTEDLIDVSQESDEAIAALRHTPAAPSVPAATSSRTSKPIAPSTSG